MLRVYVFFVRSSQNCTLTFSLFTNENLINSVTKKCESYKSEEIDFFLNQTVHLDYDSCFYILIEQQEDEEKTPFVFDTLIIFFQEG